MNSSPQSPTGRPSAAPLGGAPLAALADSEAAFLRLATVWAGARPAFESDASARRPARQGPDAAGSEPGLSAVESSAAAGSSAVGSAAIAADLAAMSDDGLVRVTRAIAELEGRLGQLKLACASAVAKRSSGGSRHDGLAGAHGFPTAERFLAATAGTSTAEAARLIAVAAATEPAESFGATRPPQYPAVAAALEAGEVTVDAAHRITSFLDAVRFEVAAERLADAERVLLERVRAVGVDGLARSCKLLRAELVPARVESDELALHEQRSVRWWEDRRGLVHLSGCFDPVTAAPIKNALDALVSADLHAARDAKSRLAADETRARVAGGGRGSVSGAAAADAAGAARGGAGAGGAGAGSAGSVGGAVGPGRALSSAGTSGGTGAHHSAGDPDLVGSAGSAGAPGAAGSPDSAGSAGAAGPPDSLSSSGVIRATDLAHVPDAADVGRAPDAADRALVDPRTIEQMAADALADLARLAVSSDDASPALANATVIARIDLQSLLDGIGHASIDGIDQPISASSARMMAATGGIIPMVCGDDGEVLDLGRRRRLFTKAQRLALAERDGGCAHPDCARPVAHTQAHHLEHWHDDGPTDLANGVLLCAFHHWMIHHDGWRILLIDGRIWFRPPARLDPRQRLRPGRRAPRLELRDALRQAA